MRQNIVAAFCLSGTVLIAGCGMRGQEAEVDRALDPVNIIDNAGLNDLMLSTADPAEAVAYFKGAVEEKPDRIDLRRDLASALVRAGRPVAAVDAWRDVVRHPDAMPEDRVKLADALVRRGAWDEAERVLDAIPPSHASYDRYRLEAMIADGNGEWDKADSLLRDGRDDG